MGLTWIFTIHELIKDSDGDPRLLGAYCADDGQWLRTYYGDPGNRWNRVDGFAFEVPKISPQN